MKELIKNIYSKYLLYPSISTDTRNIKPDSIFFSLKGANFNGNEFAEQSLSLGSKYAIVDEEKHKTNANILLVPDVLETLQQLANYHRKQLHIPIIGITGSNGKTTTKELINAVLQKKFNTYATIGNLNNHIGVPLTLLSMTRDTELGIVEMGANHQGEIALLSRIAEPDYGLITNIGKAHLEGFGGIEGVRKGKGELYQFIQSRKGKVFVNADSNVLMEMSQNLDRICYSLNNKGDINGSICSYDPFVSLKWHSSITSEVNTINSSLIGEYNAINIMAAITIGNYFGIPDNAIKQAIESYVPTNNRSQILKKESNILILDAYNANPTSMEAAIVNFSKMEASNKILILGDMLELGADTAKEHEAIIRLIERNKFGNVILIGNYFFEHDSSFLKFKTTEECSKYLIRNKPMESAILIKGSRGMKLEKLTEIL